MPERIQLSRAKGWRKPENTTVVARPSKFGNPITMSDVGAQYPSLDDRAIATLVVRDFEVLAKNGTLHFPNWRRLGGERGPIRWNYPPLDEIRSELAGKNLACWCPLDQPCHADVLLAIANPAPEPTGPIPALAAAQIKLLIHDLDNARADGIVLTYGYIQHRLRAILDDPANAEPAHSELAQAPWRVGTEWYLEGVLYREILHASGYPAAYADPAIAEGIVSAMNDANRRFPGSYLAGTTALAEGQERS